MSLLLSDENGNVVGRQETETNWVIFMVLDQPINYRQVVTNFSNPDALFGPEVRQSTTRSIVVTTRTQIPAGVFEIECRSE